MFGVCPFSEKTMPATQIPWDGSKIMNISCNRKTFLLLDHQHQVWIFENNGTTKHNENEIKFTPVTNLPPIQQIAAGTHTALLDFDGNVWIDTEIQKKVKSTIFSWVSNIFTPKPAQEACDKYKIYPSVSHVTLINFNSRVIEKSAHQ